MRPCTKSITCRISLWNDGQTQGVQRLLLWTGWRTSCWKGSQPTSSGYKICHFILWQCMSWLICVVLVTFVLMILSFVCLLSVTSVMHSVAQAVRIWECQLLNQEKKSSYPTGSWLLICNKFEAHLVCYCCMLLCCSTHLVVAAIAATKEIEKAKSMPWWRRKKYTKFYKFLNSRKHVRRWPRRFIYKVT